MFPAEAAIFIGHEGVLFIDARPAKMYRKAHVPGAVPVEWLSFKERGGVRPTGKIDPDVQRLAQVFGEVGLAREDWAIVVGDPTRLWGEEGRIAWVLRFLGHEKVSVVDGGWAAWTAKGLPTQRGRIELPPTKYEATARPEVRAQMEEVRGWVDDGRVWNRVLVDVRSDEEYMALPGAPKYGAARAGHIPGAVNLTWNDLLDDDGFLLPRDRLEPILIGRGVRPDAEIVTYCTGGVRSAHTWYVLESLGYPRVRNYAGSWWEWSLDRRNPIRPGTELPPPEGPPWPPVDSAASGAPSEEPVE